MRRRCLLVIAVVGLAGHWSLPSVEAQSAQAGQAFSRTWGGKLGANDWERFYHYPYFFYPQNYWGQEYYKSSNSLYYRYPNEMRIPAYNRKWHNPYPSCRPYHAGHHFQLDVF